MALIIGSQKKNKLNGTNGNDVMLGLGGNDTLIGKDGNDKLVGGAGNDTVDGGRGKDKLLGGSGNDVLKPGNDLVTDVVNGGAGFDTVDYSNHSFAVQASLPDNAGAGPTVDIFISVENVIGSAFADNMRSHNGGFAFGNGGNDTLYGGGTLNATDNGGIIRGDAGGDTLHMEFGNTLAWLQRGQGADTLLNFVENQDRLFIKLSDWGLGPTLDVGEVVNNFSGISGDPFPRFTYNVNTGQLFFDPDGPGAGAQELITSITVGIFLGLDDFVV